LFALWRATLKFDKVETEDDTGVILSLESLFDEYETLYQNCIWDGIKGQSLIFDNNDISHVDLDTLIHEVRHSPLVLDGAQEVTTRIGE
jgi:hypothetical protein